MRRLNLLLFLFFVFQIGCTRSVQKSRETFIFCSIGSPTSFNPQISVDGASFNASSRTLYNRLLKFKQGTTQLEPSLAESWEISKDGLTYTFKLKKGVKFHTTSYFTPTREFNADDVIFTFDRQRVADNPYHRVNGGSYEYFNSMEMQKLIAEIIRIDSHTVQIILTKKEAPFLANLAMDFASILSKEYADKLLQNKNPEKIDFEPIGTGPFVFKRYVKDTLIRYTSHKDYHLGEAKIKKLVFAITPDPSVRYQKLKTGECHLINEPSPIDIKEMQKNKDIKLVSQAGMNVGYLAMNTQKAPFDNVLVRKAINHALNKENYINAVYLGAAEVAKNPMPPSVWSYNTKIVGYKYDVLKAKALLKKAGFSKGFDTTLWTLPVSRPYNPNGKKMGEMMQADLAKVGIKVKLVTYDWGTYLKRSRDGEHDLLQAGWNGDNGDPDNFLHTLLSCASIEPGMNYSRWCDQKFSLLSGNAKKLSDVGKREELYKKAQVIFHEKAPWVPIAHSIVYKAMRANVKGYVQSPLATEDFYPIYFQ